MAGNQGAVSSSSSVNCPGKSGRREKLSGQIPETSEDFVPLAIGTSIPSSDLQGSLGKFYHHSAVSPPGAIYGSEKSLK